MDHSHVLHEVDIARSSRNPTLALRGYFDTDELLWLSGHLQDLEHVTSLRLIDDWLGRSTLGPAFSSILRHFPNLKHLDLSGNAFDATSTHHAAVALQHTVSLETMNLATNALSVDASTLLAHHVARMPNLSSLVLLNVSLTNAALVALIPSLASHPSLRHLVLSDNLIGDDSVNQLLQSLASQARPTLRRLELPHNSVSIVPGELLATGDAIGILDFYRKSLGGRPLLQALLLIVGMGRVGKSHVCRRLIGNSSSLGDPSFFHAQLPSTQNIDIFDWTTAADFSHNDTMPSLPLSSRTVAVRVYDFGGQPQLYASHRFFLNNERAMYIHVLDATQTAADNRLTYWLRRIARHSPTSPVIIVVTKCDLAQPRPLRRLEQLTIGNLKDTTRANVIAIIDGYGVGERPLWQSEWPPEGHMAAQAALRGAIEKAIPLVPQLTQPYPPAFHELVRRVRSLWAHEGSVGNAVFSISESRFIALAKECDLTHDAERARAYLQICRNLGLVHWIGDHPESDSGGAATTRVFDPEWVKGPMYHLIRTPASSLSRPGVLTSRELEARLREPVDAGDLRPVWKAQPWRPEDTAAVIDLMRWCGLCFPFRLHGEQAYLLPDLLPIKAAFDVWPTRDTYRGPALEYEFLDDSVLLRFVGRWYDRVESPQSCFRNQVIVNPTHGYQALVTADVERRCVVITIRGPENGARREQWWRVRTALEDIDRPVTTPSIQLSTKPTNRKPSRVKPKAAKIEDGVDATHRVARILFLAANPVTTNRLDLEEELRSLELELGAVRHRDQVVFTARHALRPDDLVRHVRSDQPAVIHFSGHGSVSGIVLRNDGDGQAEVSGPHLRRFLDGRGVELLVLNACSTKYHAKHALGAVRCVVGTTSKVSDEAARRFTVAFYRALGNGLSVREAFRDGGDAVALYGLEDVFWSLGDLDHTLFSAPI